MSSFISSEAALQPPESGLFILDCDEVLLVWWRGFVKWLMRTGRIAHNPGAPRMYDLERWLGVSTDTAMQWVHEFNDTPETGFEALSPLEGAQRAIRMMRDNGFRIRVLSTCSELLATRQARTRNLIRIFGDVFDEVVCIQTRTSKLEELLRHPRAIFIDDHINNAHAGFQAGHEPIIMKTSHNAENFGAYVEAYTGVDGWEDFLIRSPFLRAPEPCASGTLFAI